MSNAEIRAHWQRVAELGCLICRHRPATLHHCHGASMLELPWQNPGMGQKQNDWLVIPLAPDYHTGRFGIDSEDLKNLSIAALIGKMMGLAEDDGDRNALQRLLDVARETGVADSMASSLKLGVKS